MVVELKCFGIHLTSNHIHWINKQIEHTNYVSAKNKSHEAQLKRHQKKYTLDCSSYVGGGAGFFDYFEQLDQLEESELDVDSDDEQFANE